MAGGVGVDGVGVDGVGANGFAMTGDGGRRVVSFGQRTDRQRFSRQRTETNFQIPCQARGGGRLWHLAAIVLPSINVLHRRLLLKKGANMHPPAHRPPKA